MTVLITGADRGLGLGLATVMLHRGYRVFAGSYLDDEHNLAALGDEFGDRLSVLPLDVTSDESVRGAFRTVAQSTDALNMLINNAGSARDRSQTITDPMYFDDIRSLYEINALGPLRVTHTFLPLLRAATPKCLVYVSSLAASIGSITRTHQYGYAMSKAALNMQSKLIHNHLANEGLRVLAVHPGWMRTHVFGDIERMKDAPFEPEQAAEKVANLIEQSPGREETIFVDSDGKPICW